jgi:signal transduction histidine kinase/FixJ family two-component response regulator
MQKLQSPPAVEPRSALTGAGNIPLERTFRTFALLGACVAALLAVIWFWSGTPELGFLVVAFTGGVLLLYVMRRRLRLMPAVLLSALLPTLWIMVFVLLSGGAAGPNVLTAGLAGIGLAGALALTLLFARTQQCELDGIRGAGLQLVSVFDTIPHGVIAVACEGSPEPAHRITYMNPAMLALLGGADTGATLEEVERTNRSMMARRLLQHLAGAQAGGVLARRFEAQSGEGTRTCEVTSRIITDGNGPLQIVSLVRDLSEDLEKQQRALHAAKLAAIGELVAGVAHELNNPLAAIKNTADLLVAENAPDHHEDILRISHSADRAARIVRSLLNFAREATPERVPTDVNDVVRHVLRLRPATNGVHVELRLADRLPLVDVDPAQIEQVLINLITNAQHSLVESQPAAPCLTIVTRADIYHVSIDVTDNGAGIPEHVLPRIFDPFFTTRQFGTGTGLGLAVCHGIVTQHGGSIRVKSEAGRGAIFSVDLPVAWSSAPANATTVAAPNDGPQRSVLIVDDEAAIRSVVGRYLRRRGHAVQEATCAADADALLGANDFDSIILDLRMPGMSGEDLFQRWQRERPAAAVRVIFATGDIVSAAPSAFLYATGQPVLAKPYDLEQLALLVEARVDARSDAAAAVSWPSGSAHRRQSVAGRTDRRGESMAS